MTINIEVLGNRSELCINLLDMCSLQLLVGNCRQKHCFDLIGLISAVRETLVSLVRIRDIYDLFMALVRERARMQFNAATLFAYVCICNKIFWDFSTNSIKYDVMILHSFFIF